jgi:hypothetical protein
VRGQAVVALVGIHDRNRDLLALPTGQLAFAQEGAEAEVCCKRRRRVRQLLHQVRDETQLALKTIKKLLIQAGGFTRGLRFRGFRRVQFSAQKSGMNAGYISGYEDVVQM